MFRAVLSTVVAIIAMLNVNATASATSVDDIKARGRILIGVDLGHPPYGMLDTKAEPIGSCLLYTSDAADE